ncbi:glycoside hydrolase family 3 protein [Microbacterium rhizomatis]|uniref:beta-glucosidase n=1 Tax=Microbacterium rhizomatis TaxID=1631477 RepID=A0A5J5IZE5_9MICO|nr:glycoside hydrolase family 3 N-terminal domain-containing protein [Microbacterium rhizomatis]KAA9106053.1 glycoside hydrolase family 3 protein [Microbacterium rhizomatis]
MPESAPRYPYQDPSLSVTQRVEDLLQRLTIDDKVGLMYQPLAHVGDMDESADFVPLTNRQLLSRRINHFNILWATSARQLAEWNNAIQATLMEHPLGIPATISSDPRHAFSNNPGAALMAGPFSQWPEPLGMAAIGSEDLVRRWADVIRQEYLAVGIRAALHPQIDLATDPRWARMSATFGEDAATASRLGVAYVLGLQGGSDVGQDSVSVMAKHFPGGGAQKDGEDPHFSYGREQVYPGGNFDLHLEPFRAVIDAGVSQIMPYYGIPVGTPFEEVAFGFNREVITGLLREQLGFDGIVCTDWGILSERPWGVEHLSVEERVIKALDAGVDQFGGESSTDVLIGLVRSGRITGSRIDTSARRLLREKFRLGLFDDPFVDVEAATITVGAETAQDEGRQAQGAAQVLLKNTAGAAHLPLDPGLRVYAEGVDPDVLAVWANVVGAPEDADVVIVRTSAPWESRGEPGTLETFFHAGSLDFPADQLEHWRELAAAAPLIVDIYLDRPAILAPVTDITSTLIANFGSADSVLINTLFGEVAPAGRLPFDIPSSMTAVRESQPDTPFDTADPTFRFGFGLDYDMVAPSTTGVVSSESHG